MVLILIKKIKIKEKKRYLFDMLEKEDLIYIHIHNSQNILTANLNLFKRVLIKLLYDR
jgi:hypothetical protein